MTARLLLLASVTATAGYAKALWIWHHAHDHRADLLPNGRLIYLDALARLDPSDETLAYIERRRAEIEAETA